MAYSPASAVSTDADLAHISNVVFFEKKMVENLKANLPFHEMCEKRRIPMNSGKTIQLFSRVPFTYNTTPTSEGTVGAGLSYDTVRQQATLSQYADYISFSDLLLETSIADELNDEAGELGYRAALTTNRLDQVQFDTTADADSNTNIDITAGTYMDASFSRRATMELYGDNVLPKGNGYFAGAIHPFAGYDLVNDNTAGGILDINKRHEGMERGVQGYRLVRHFDVDWILTTTVGTTSNYQSGGNTGYHAYVFGKDAFITVSLGSMEPPSNQKNFKVMVKKYNEPDRSDPAKLIGGTVGYNFKHAITPPPGQPTTILNRFRRIRSEASIS